MEKPKALVLTPQQMLTLSHSPPVENGLSRSLLPLTNIGAVRRWLDTSNFPFSLRERIPHVQDRKKAAPIGSECNRGRENSKKTSLLPRISHPTVVRKSQILPFVRRSQRECLRAPVPAQSNHQPQPAARMQLIDTERLEELIRSSIEILCRYFFSAGRKEGREWKIGDVTGVAGNSLGIQLTGDKAGVWHDRATGQGGNFTKLIMENRVCIFPQPRT